MSFVFDLTKKGIDVFDEGLTPNDYILKLNLNTFKILAKVNYFDLTVSGNPTTFTQSHSYGYAPNFYAFCKFPDGKVAMAGPLSFPYDRDTRVLFTGPSFTPEVDASNFYFILTKPGANYDVDIALYVFEVEL